jgi:UDP-N-acetylglucosamine acyltransferase
MPKIHPTAVIDPKAELANDVEIRAYVIIEGRVTIGAGTVVHPHSVIQGHTVLGAACKIGPAAYVGMDPQHLGFKGIETSLYIGDGSIVRETAQVHRAFTSGEKNATRLGQRCFIMSGAHVGHDCKLADDVILASGALLGGHCCLGTRVFIGGGAALHQFLQVGRLAIISGLETVTRDVLPFAAVRYGGFKGYNAIGCRRAGLSRDAIRGIRLAYRCIHTNRTTPAAMAAIECIEPMVDEVREILDFAKGSKRGLQPSVRYAAQHGPHPSDLADVEI